jgi:hypothetical protein
MSPDISHVGFARTVAVLDYVGGHVELEQSDMIFTPFASSSIWKTRSQSKWLLMT